MVQLDRFRGPPQTEGAAGVPLPVRDPEATWYRATVDEASAVFRVDGDADPPEVRIPYVVSDAGGAFATLMDSLVSELGITRVRFVNLPPEGAMVAIDEEIAGKTHVRDIREAVQGFDLVDEEWDREPYEDEPAVCLVGEWHPGDPPGDDVDDVEGADHDQDDVDDQDQDDVDVDRESPA